jgi:hypothetical protein
MNYRGMVEYIYLLMKYYYANQKTCEFLSSREERVYLWGGYVGNSNFGDIVQLKNTIWFYKQYTHLTPVIVLSLDFLGHDRQVEDYQKWFQIRNILFISDEPYLVEKMGIIPLKAVSPGGILHIYGGGFLNRHWQHERLDKLKSLIDDISVNDYIFSGQQIDEATVPALKELFRHKTPLLFGVRDRDSFNYMAQILRPSTLFFSFDDVTEIFTAWKASENANFKSRLISRFALKPQSILWHINTSGYTKTNKVSALQTLNKVKRRFPSNRLVLAQAWNDPRAISVLDTLQSVIQFGNYFPYVDYRIVNFAKLALDIDPERGYYPSIANLYHNTSVSVASSYHMAMLAVFFDTPSYLIAKNEFYGQKREALGLVADLDEFLNNPIRHKTRYTEEIIERGEWISTLIEKIDQANSTVAKKVKRIRQSKDSLVKEFVPRG